MSSIYVLVVSHGDRSGLQHAWGPYDSEEDAQQAWHWLQGIGVFGLGEILPLRAGMPATRRERLEEQQRKYAALLGIGIPAQQALDIVEGEEA